MTAETLAKSLKVCERCDKTIEGVRYELRIVWQNGEETIMGFHGDCLRLWVQE